MKYSFKESDYTTGYDCICVRLRSSWILLDSFIHSFIPSYRGKEQPPKRVLHRVRFNAPSFNFQYPLFSSRSSSNCLRLLLRLLVTPILPSIYPSIACLTREFLSKMWPIHLNFLLFILCRIFLSSKFRRPKNLRSKCNTLLVSSLNMSPSCRRKKPSSSWMVYLPWQPWI